MRLFRAFALLFALAAAGLAAPPETGFLNRTVAVDGVTYRYQVFLPANWTPDQKWPIVLFLHGAGERGDDGLAQTDVGLGHALRRFPDRYPAVVVLPQCRNDKFWSEPAMEAQALAALERSSKEFNGDPARTYLTGLSLGGYGTWAIAVHHSGKFAAIAPVCGGVMPPGSARPMLPELESEGGDPYVTAAKKVGSTPVWIFHGAADSVVPVAESQKMNAAVKAAGGDVRYTEYPGVNHNSWDKAYAEPEFPKWLLSQKLR
jgi:predicted peptidase